MNKKANGQSKDINMDEVAAIAITKAIIEFKNSAPKQRDPDPLAEGWEGFLGIALNEMRGAFSRFNV